MLINIIKVQNVYSRWPLHIFSISNIFSTRPGQVETGATLGWEWLSPYASFDGSTPA